jgi:aryl-phospho-beta-D-glucosidase BglC (GH1 family)
MMTKGFLQIHGDNIVKPDGTPVVLRGFGLGGWMNMENFITGYSGNEEAQRQAVRQVLGDAKYELFYDRFLEYFFTEDDARYVKSLGLNLIRIPVNYRHFEDDMNPFVIKESGFKTLDRVVDACARNGIYTIIDLHALPGYQNQAWHSDNPTHKAFFWVHKHFQDRTVKIWEAIANHYKDNPWVAGYNPINEPYDPSEKLIEPIYRRLANAIRAIDPDHILFLEGNRYSQDFYMFSEPLPNSVYTNHDYAPSGFNISGPYPGVTQGVYYDKDVLEKQFLDRSQFMLQHNMPIWVGEFGAVYTGNPAVDEDRYQVVCDQLDNYKKKHASWSIWLYKDIGLQAVTYPAPDSPWMERIQPFLAKKARLGADSWGGVETNIEHVMNPLNELMEREFPNFNPGPFGSAWEVRRLVRHVLISEALLPEFAESFRGMSEVEIDEMMQSFLFKNCVQRTELARILSEDAG